MDGVSNNGGNLIGVGLGLVSGSRLVGNGGGSISWGGMDGVSNNGGVVDGVVSHGVDSVVSHGVDSVVSHGVDSVVSHVVSWVQDVLDSTIGGSQGENSSSK